jgi:hypothetical protein
MQKFFFFEVENVVFSQSLVCPFLVVSQYSDELDGWESIPRRGRRVCSTP